LANLLRALHVLRPRARCAVAAKHQQSQVTEAAGQASGCGRTAVLLRTLRRSQGGTRAHAQVVTELAYGGEVFDHLLVNGPCTEDEARSVMRQLVGSPC
jgi:phage terminase large subunit-like protein